MEDISTLRQTARAFREKGAFDQAVKIYELLWMNHRDDCDQWDGWGYAQSLRKLGNSQLAYTICQDVYQTAPDFKYNNNLLAWCLYDVYINKNTLDIQKNETDFFQAASRILSSTQQDELSPFSKTVFKVVDYLKATRANFPAVQINEWLDKLDKAKLSQKTWQGTDHRGRVAEQASDLERWYAKKCKVYFELRRYQDCIILGLEAFTKITEFHNSYDKWIRREMALSYGEIGKPQDGVVLFEKFMDVKAEWYLYYEMGTLLYKCGQVENALKHAVRAALDPKELGFRVDVFEFIGKVLFEKGDIEYGRRNLLLTAKIKVEKDWKVSYAFQELLNQAQVDINENITSRSLEKELTPYWESLLHNEKETAFGKVKNLVASGKSGFIIGDNNKEYYFRVNDFRSNPSNIKPGVRVKFFITPSTQPGKLDNAVNINVLKE